MSKNSAIQICLRVRPVPEIDPNFHIDQQQNKVHFHIAKNKEMGYINNSEESRVFSFDQVFDMSARQEKIFDKVAKDVIDSALDGYNGTIFAYGQTGSGKTFTMTGQSENYNNRGLIPRTISYIFGKKMERNVQVIIRYFQIYNEDGYDLLCGKETKGKLEDLNKMRVLTSASGELRIDNLSEYNPQNEQQALQLLFVGDNNRIVCKTPMNDQSTRSHCIFMVKVICSSPASDIKSEATIHLVDLSGSERIKATNVQGLLQRQALSINTSLHHLERVIVSLNDKVKDPSIHIPYRDSLMTHILKDSLGGNCKTRMVATMSPRTRDLLEGIATCKFAMRVAMIKNTVERNESIDPGVIIAKLKQENMQLKAELALLRGGDVKDSLERYEVEECQDKVKEYLDSDDPSKKIILKDQLRIQECFYYFKTLLKEARASGGGMAKSYNKPDDNRSNKVMPNGPTASGQEVARYEDQIKKLKLLIHQRENQITLLLSVINKNNKEGGSVPITIPVKRQEQTTNNTKSIVESILHEKQVLFPAQIEQRKMEQQQRLRQSLKESSIREKPERSQAASSDLQQIQSMLLRPLNLTSEQLLNHTVAFEQFRKAYRKQQVIQQNEQIMKQKMEQGKQLGKVVNKTREDINRLKIRLETLREQMVVQSLVSNKEQPDEHPEEAAVIAEMNKMKETLRVNFDKLRELKNQITTIQALVKKNTEILQRDFEKYLAFTEKERREATKAIEPSVLASSIQDQEVQKHLKSFFNARDELRRK